MIARTNLVGEPALKAASDLQPGLTTAPEADGRLTLIGRKCDDCGARFFPARARCVACYGGNIAPVELERVGTVDTFTIVRQAPPGYHGQVPYALGMVVLGNAVHVLAHLTGKAIDTWRRGDTVAAYALPLLVGPERQPRRTYAFRPASEEDLCEV